MVDMESATPVNHPLAPSLSWRGTRKSGTRASPVNDLQLEPGKPGNLLYLSQDVADPERAMVCGALAAPDIDEGRGIERESQPAIRVADFQALSGQRLALRRQELKTAVVGLGEGQDGDGALADAGFDTHAMAGLAVV